MKVQNIKVFEDAFVSSSYPNKNFSNENVLVVLKRENFECDENLINSLTKFNIEENIHCSDVCKVELKLFVRKISCNGMYIDILYNLEDYDFECVDYATAPKGSLFKKNLFISGKLQGNYISIDITELFEEFSEIDLENISITIKSSDNYNGEVIFDSSRGINGPSLSVLYKENCCCDGIEWPSGLEDPRVEEGAIGPICSEGPRGPEGPEGPMGIEGPQGPQGIEGPEGPQGEQGEEGPEGPQGIQGLKGERGPRGPVGPMGPKGDKGDKGEQGARGPEGIQGPKGEKGEQGPEGPEGPQGIQGPVGERGLRGEKGEKGDPGEQGLRGPEGPRGPQGIQGERGPKGEQGEQGPEGVKGSEGPRGKIGPEGPRGPIGPRGPQGFKGEKGDRGEEGPRGPKGDSGTSVTDEYACISSDKCQLVQGHEDIRLYENIIISGTSIQHVEGANNISLENGSYLVNFSTSVSGEICSIAEVRLILNGKSVGIAASEIIKKGMIVNISSSAIINVCDCDNKAFLKLVNGSKIPLNYFLTRINIVKII